MEETKATLLNSIAKNYIELKKHEYESIKNKLALTSTSFTSAIKENNYNAYRDIHIILNYNYKNYPIREDKFFHALNDTLIDITHFTKEKDDLIDILTKKLKERLKKYKIKEDLIRYELRINLENFYVNEEGLLYVYSLNQFGIKATDEFTLLIKFTDIYE